MTRRKKRNHSTEFKAKVALAATKGDKTLAELATMFDIHANQMTLWKQELIENASSLFGKPSHSRGAEHNDQSE